jgi:hypothetical protein
MHQHRFRHQQDFGPVLPTATDAPATGAFMVCPVALSQGWMGQPGLWLAAYQRAYECAQAVLRPSQVERLQAASWN